LAQPFDLSADGGPRVFLVVGVNGTGKTTTAAKMAHQFKRHGLKVMLAAADTFRAAAIEQLKVWGERVGAEVVAKAVGGLTAELGVHGLARIGWGGAGSGVTGVVGGLARSRRSCRRR